MICSNVVRAQYFESNCVVDSREVPCVAFLYKYPPMVIRQAAQHVLGRYNVTSFYSGGKEYFEFSGDSLGLVLMQHTRIKYWVEDMGDEKGALYLTAFREPTKRYASSLNFAIVLNKIKEELSAIEIECINITNSLFLAEQYQKVMQLTHEIQTLHDDLRRLETQTPTATTQINQIRSSLRIKRAALNQETELLNRLKEMVSDS